jgi:hypothetical protein
MHLRKHNQKTCDMQRTKICYLLAQQLIVRIKLASISLMEKLDIQLPSYYDILMHTSACQFSHFVNTKVIHGNHDIQRYTP